MGVSIALRPNSQERVDPLVAFIARAQARALLVNAGWWDLHDAVDGLRRDAVNSGLAREIGPDEIQKTLTQTFRK
jgi:hypothetical protein